MMRVLEFIVALVIVAVAGVVVGVVMPGSGHVERSLVIGKDMRQVYDVLDNFQRFQDYTVLRSYDAKTQFTLSGKAYGPGAEISWSSDDTDAKVGQGKLTIATSEPTFDKIDSTAKTAQVVWNLDNDWRGQDKHFTFDLERQGSRGQLTKVTWSYDVAYGFNLIDRYSRLYIHGNPDSFIQFSLNNLQNVLASVPNIDYSKLIPYIRQTQPTPVLLVSTQIARKDGLTALDDATATAVKQLQDAAKKLGVSVTGPRIIFTTNYGDQNYTFDVALPISATSLTVAGQSHDLAAPQAPKLDAASSTSDDDAAKQDAAAAPGSLDRFGRLVVDSNIRAELAFGGPALEAPWSGTAAGVPQTRDMLKAYAQTHGYKYDEVNNRLYDIQTASGDNVKTFSKFEVYLPLTGGAPAQTPEQEASIAQPSLDAAPASSSSAPAPASSAAAPASDASSGH